MTSFLQQLERDSRPLSEAEAEMFVASVCFKTGPPGPVGVEIERIIHDHEGPHLPVPADRVRAAMASVDGPLPGGGLISFEPGGQLEISSACAPGLPRLIRGTRADVAVVESLLADAGLRSGGLAMDAHRPPLRSLRLPRYAAMEQHFRRSGGAGLTMMCSTAALQVSLDAGLDTPGADGLAARWRHMHSLLPVLVAMFANSPFRNGAPTGWRSSRQASWLATDPSRTAQPPLHSPDPRLDWARYALDALVLCIPSRGKDRNAADDASWQAPAGLTMREWLRGNGPRPATEEDLRYHLSTLFPPVRPQGFLELRVIDAQAGGDWEVPAAVVTALMDDPRASAAAAEACEPLSALEKPLETAARSALSHTVLAKAALTCAEAAVDALPRLCADGQTSERVHSFIDRYTIRNSSPADAILGHWHRTGSMLSTDPEDTP